METWKTNLDETKKRYIDWWNHKGIILNMWEHFQEGVKPHADIPAPSPAKDLNQNGSIRNGVQNTWTGTWHTAV